MPKTSTKAKKGTQTKQKQSQKPQAKSSRKGKRRTREENTTSDNSEGEQVKQPKKRLCQREDATEDEDEEVVEVISSDEQSNCESESEVRSEESVRFEYNSQTCKGDDGLKSRHHSEIPTRKPSKQDSTKDLLLVFSRKKRVTFTKTNGSADVEIGRWCRVCK
jgi:hypothetical protein